MARKIERELVVDPGGPVVLWDPPGPEGATAGGTRRGFLLDAAFCSNPECRWAHLLAVSVEDGDVDAVDVKWDDDEYQRSKIQVSLNLDTGELDIPPEPEEHLREPGLESRIRALLCREGSSFREVLEKRWRHMHSVNREAWRHKDWSSWEEGVLVPWADVHPDDFILLFESGEKRYWVEDLYCITPGCSCRDATVFLHRLGKKVAQVAGVFKVDIHRWKASREKSGAPLSPREQQLWEDWNRCYPGLRKELSRRQEEMRRLGPEIVKLSTGTPRPTLEKEAERRVGRNDPCPCGSGRKYKKCCLDK